MKISKNLLLFLIFILLLSFVLYLNHIKIRDTDTEFSGMYGNNIFCIEIQNDKIICTSYTNTPNAPNPDSIKWIEIHYFENEICTKHETTTYYNSYRAIDNYIKGHKEDYKNGNIRVNKDELSITVTYNDISKTKNEIKENTINNIVNRLPENAEIFIKENGVVRIEHGKN